MRNTKVIDSLNMRVEDFNYRYYQTRNGLWCIEKRVKKKFLWFFTRIVWTKVYLETEDYFGDIYDTELYFDSEDDVRKAILDDIADEEEKLAEEKKRNEHVHFYRYMDTNPDGTVVSFWSLPKGY